MLKMGLVSAAGERARGVLEAGLGGALGEPCAVRLWPSYEALVDALVSGDEDLAWLPPVAYLRARQRGAIELLATIERGGRSRYGAVLLGRADTAPSLHLVEGKRALWIDPWSAAGYLVPRALLRDAGHDPTTLFASEAFAHDYRVVLESLDAGRADVGACYARLDDRGALAGGPWMAHPDLILLASGGSIPSDTLCTSPRVDPDRRAHLTALLTSHLPPPALLVVLETSSLRVPDLALYDEFARLYDH